MPINPAMVDDNQKTRRPRGGRARRLWLRWSQKNPTLVTLSLVFVCLCSVGILVENLAQRVSPGVHRHGLKQRIRRAKALFHQATHGHKEEDDESKDDEPKERKHAGHGNGGGGGGHHADRKPNKLAGDDEEEEEELRYPKHDAMTLLEKLDRDVRGNRDEGIRWTAPFLMLPLLATPGRQLKEQNDDEEMTRGIHRRGAVDPNQVDVKSSFFRVKRSHEKPMAWESEFEALKEADLKPAVDYTTHKYDYPPLRSNLPDLHDHGPGNYPDYPPLQPLGDLMKAWPQDNDFPGAHQRPIPEKLLHFNFSNPQERDMARKFRDAELPFKLYDVPEVTAATKKWRDDYLAPNFDPDFVRNRGDFMDHLLGNNKPKVKHDDDKFKTPPQKAHGNCQESPNNYFAFFDPSHWDVRTMGLPPVRTNDWSFEQWSRHAQYADAVALSANKPHFYWQSGVPREERLNPESEWTFISRDLPSFSSAKKTFFVFEPESQKGIQCRFGERGVVAATHYDSGRNMIAMVTGAKRYILAPPKECAKLGIVPWKFNAAYRHSLLNFGHINYMNETSGELDDGEQGETDTKRHKRQWKGDHMSQVEREWMEMAASSSAIETVLKAGEVLYIPSHWFHYIVSLQKSAQCNVRSGVHDEGTAAFGGKAEVKTCGRLSKAEVMGRQ